MSASNMRILVLDIETCPNLVYTWGLWNQNIPITNIVEPTQMLSWAAKWVGKSKVYYKNRNSDDFLDTIWSMIDKADAVVTYNGTNFDMKHLNREFAEAGMEPPFQPPNIDLIKTVKKRFRFPSNKMDYVTGRLLGENKEESGGWNTWIGCMNNRRDSWAALRKYNIADVVLTEKLYLHLRGWIHNHPNHGLYVEDQENPVCRNCGSDHVQSRGWQATATRGYQRYKCMECGANLRGRKMIKGGAASPQVVS